MVGSFPAIQLALDFVAALTDAAFADQPHAHVAEAADFGRVCAGLNVVELLAVPAGAGVQFGNLSGIPIGNGDVALRFSPHAR